MRLIHEIAAPPGEVERRKEEMVRSMAWRSPDTLKAYEHYFQAIHHAQMQDMLHQQLDKKLKDYVELARRKKRLPKEEHAPAPARLVSDQEVGWGSLLDFAGEEHEEYRAFAKARLQKRVPVAGFAGPCPVCHAHSTTA